MEIKLTSTKKIPDYLIDRVQGSNYDVIYRAIEELNSIEVQDRIWKVLNDIFLLTASSDGLDIWEAFYDKRPSEMPDTFWRQLVLTLNSIVVNGPTMDRILGLIRMFDATVTLTRMESSVLYKETSAYTPTSECTLLKEGSTASTATPGYTTEMYITNSDTELYKLNDFTEEHYGYGELLLRLLNIVLPANVHIVAADLTGRVLGEISPVLTLNINNTASTAVTAPPPPPPTISLGYQAIVWTLGSPSSIAPSRIGVYDFTAGTYIREFVLTGPAFTDKYLAKVDVLPDNKMVLLWYKVQSSVNVDASFQVYLFDVSAQGGGSYTLFMDNIPNSATNNNFRVLTQDGFGYYNLVTKYFRFKYWVPQSFYSPFFKTTFTYSDGEFALFDVFDWDDTNTVLSLGVAKYSPSTVVAITNQQRIGAFRPSLYNMGRSLRLWEFNTTPNLDLANYTAQGAKLYPYNTTDFLLLGSGILSGAPADINGILSFKSDIADMTYQSTILFGNYAALQPISYMNNRVLVCTGGQHATDTYLYFPEYPSSSTSAAFSAGALASPAYTLEKSYQNIRPLDAFDICASKGGGSGHNVLILRNFISHVDPLLYPDRDFQEVEHTIPHINTSTYSEAYVYKT